MFSKTDYDKLQQIMDESPEKKELLTNLLTSHQITISTISHEIRNPLTLVYSTLQLIESSHPEVLSFRYWSDIRNDIEYMKLLLEELSAYNNGNRLSLSHIDSNTFFKKLALSFAASLIETPIQFVSEIASNLPPLYADYVKLREVFLNLLNNAREALDVSPCQNTSESIIRLSVAYNNDSFIITISDNGCGIPNEHLSHIFEPFITYKKNGTGLGLALVSRIVTAHNGNIDVRSFPGSYTTFTITLPIEKNT